MTVLLHSWPDHPGHLAHSSFDRNAASTNLFECQLQIMLRQDSWEGSGARGHLLAGGGEFWSWASAPTFGLVRR